MAVLFAVGAVVAGALTVGAVASGAATIRPGQHFHALVNGQRAKAVVAVVCPGPVSAGSVGAVLGGQTFSVVRDRNGGGNTGPFSQVHAWFVQNAGVNGPLAATMTSYGTTVAIPVGMRVPCGGSGRVEFSSCPYHAPCAAGWVPAYVSVRFGNVAA